MRHVWGIDKIRMGSEEDIATYLGSYIEEHTPALKVGDSITIRREEAAFGDTSVVTVDHRVFGEAE